MSSKKNARKQVEAAVSDVEEESTEEVSEPEPEPETKTKKRGAPAAAAKKSAKKSKPPSSAEESNSDAAEEDDAEEDEVEEVKPVKGKRGRAKAVDSEWKEKQPAKKASGGKKSGIKKELQLSKDLATVVGSDKMSRSEAVKRVWAYIKENKLTDPENKQFAICDAKLEKVIGLKRFKSFGMMKYLKDHFVS